MLAFRDTPPDGDAAPRGDPRAVVIGGDGDVALGCAACRTRITSRAAAIAIAGSHEHACVNPHG